MQVLPEHGVHYRMRSRHEMESARVDTSLLLEGTTGAETHTAIKPASRVIELKCTVAQRRTTGSRSSTRHLSKAHVICYT